MSEVKRDEIIYEEGWREASPVVREKLKQEPDTPEDDPEKEASPTLPDQEKKKTPASASVPSLMTIRLALCLLAALVLFLLKAMDSDAYRRFMAYYREEQQKPLISRDVFNAVDVGALFSQNAVTVRETPDEAAPAAD